MKHHTLFFLIFICISCGSKEQQQEVLIDSSKHEGLSPLDNDLGLKVFYSEAHKEEAQKQSELMAEAYDFLSAIMGEKKDFALLLVSNEDWERNAYSPVPGMPEYYKGNLIVGAGVNALAEDYGDMLASFPREMTSSLYQIYGDSDGGLNMKLFFDKQSFHELTHNFQDPLNQETFSLSRWLEEIHANAGLYAFYKYKRPRELPQLMTLVEFSLQNPPPDLPYQTLEDFDKHYYEMAPPNYGQYQMKFTQLAKEVVDSLGKEILKPLNDFLISYDESYKGKWNEEELRQKLGEEVHPYLAQKIGEWDSPSIERPDN